MPSRIRTNLRGRLGALACALLAAAVAFAVVDALGAFGGEAENPLAACLSGEAQATADPDASDSGRCALREHPETFADLATAARGLQWRLGADSPAAAIAAARVRRAAAHRSSVPGTRGRWKAVGNGPLHADDPAYTSTYGDGFGTLSGRISDYAYDSAHHRLYAAVSAGGIWTSADGGNHWRSIGSRLPTQSTSSVAYSRARGGTVLALTGDDAFGGNTYGGLGVFRTTDGGRHWRRSRGVPAGALGFKLAVDPGNPRTVYAATGAGLFRSTNDGKSFRDVNLPIGGPCQGLTLHKPNCFFANVVTDVVVQAKDKFGHGSGAVLAAVGWRAGARKNLDGVPESPSNGLYSSSSGRPGSFKGLGASANGFAPQPNIGRVELGVATGPDQNHAYVYAVVQDAELFDKGTVEGLDTPSLSGIGLPVDPTASPTYFNGVYVSSDFGRSWKLMEGRQQLLSPTSGSVLAQLLPLGFGPGIQSWYDEWIKPDPTMQGAGGVPTRVVFGLEELYENRLPLPQDGPSDFKVIGAYNADGGGCLLVLATPACAAAHSADPTNTTTHPDQHAGIFVPDKQGGVSLVAGNDGGNYAQHVGSGSDFTQRGFGPGAQGGLHTLQPYGVTGSGDGTVYMGMQDNGEGKITPKGRQVEVFGGDGVFTVADPQNSDVAYEELPNAGTNVTTDGGKTWTDIDPFVDDPSFYAPLVMDPLNPRHLLTGGREIVETTHGPSTTSPGTPSAPTDWKVVENLGRANGTSNQASAIAVRGKSVYAGYCGGCDVVVSQKKFASGIATNVGGSKAPKPGTKRGWHKVPAKGLPHRFISSITIDPHRKKTIYVTLGASDVRPYAPAHAEGRKTGLSAGGGHVYRSTDGGRRFTDISANLEHVPALWSLVRGRQLLVATTQGVFASRGTRGGHYALLGHGLPAAPVFDMQLVPGHRRQLLVASLGRGVYRYTFP
jgi:hypothetical protein